LIECNLLSYLYLQGTINFEIIIVNKTLTKQKQDYSMELVPSHSLEKPFNLTDNEHWNIRGLMNRDHYIQLTPDEPASFGYISSKEVLLLMIC
jgi:hypothetical protein